MGHFERMPYTDSTMRSIYHIREYDVFRLAQVRPLPCPEMSPRSKKGTAPPLPSSYLPLSRLAPLHRTPWRSTWPATRQTLLHRRDSRQPSRFASPLTPPTNASASLLVRRPPARSLSCVVQARRGGKDVGEGRRCGDEDGGAGERQYEWRSGRWNEQCAVGQEETCCGRRAGSGGD